METMHAAGRRTLPPVPRPNPERAAAATEEPGRDDSPTERFVVDLTAEEQGTVRDGTVEAPEDVAPHDQGSDGAATEDDATEDDATEGTATEGTATEGTATEGTATEDEVDADAYAEDEGPADAVTEDEVDADADACAEDDAPADDEDAGPVGVRADAEPAVVAPSSPDDMSLAEGPELDPGQQYVACLRAAADDFADAAAAESAVVREAVPPARHRRARCRLVLRYADEAEVDVTFLGPAGQPGTPSRHGFDRQIRRWLEDGQCRDDAWLVADPDAADGLAVDLNAWIAAA